jgi:inner membrane protein YidH
VEQPDVTDTAPGGTPAAPIDTGTRLAVDRTRLAYERTLMAWVRTAASLISFGFTIYKFFDYEQRGRPSAPDGVLGPRGYALIMIAIGLVSLLLATIQHRHSMRMLRTEYGAIVPRSTATVVGGLFAILGILAFLAALFNR